MSEDKNQNGFYYIEIRSKALYKAFRTRCTGENSGIERVVGQRTDGSWETITWLVSKQLAHVENGRLVADHPNAKEIFDRLGAEPKHIEGSRFEAKDDTDCAKKSIRMEQLTRKAAGSADTLVGIITGDNLNCD